MKNKVFTITDNEETSPIQLAHVHGSGGVIASIIYDENGNMGGGNLKAKISPTKDFAVSSDVPGSSSASNNKLFTMEVASSMWVKFVMEGATTNPNQKIALIANIME